MVTADYEAGSRRIVLEKSAVTEDFFKLSTNLAGNVLQKFIDYEVKIAVVGDFSGHASKPLRDFIHESNRGRDVFFVSTVDQANERLASF